MTAQKLWWNCPTFMATKYKNAEILKATLILVKV